jgi:hypothetical protein
MNHDFFTHTNLTICMKRLALRWFLERDTQSGQKIMLAVFYSGERLLFDKVMKNVSPIFNTELQEVFRNWMTQFERVFEINGD